MSKIDKKRKIEGTGWSHIQIINSCVFGSVTGVTFMIGYLRQIGFNEIQLSFYGTIIGIAGLFNILGAWVSLGSGNLKRVFLGLSTISVIFCFMGVVVSYIAAPVQNIVVPLVIMAFFLLWQIMTFMSIPPLLSWLNCVVEPAHWNNFFSTRMIVSDIAILVTSMLAGILLGGDPGTVKFLVIFLVSMVFALLGIYFMNKVPGAVTGYKSVSLKSFFVIFRKSLKRGIFKYLLLVIFLRAFAYSLIMPFQPVFLLERLKLDYTMIAVMTNLSLIFAILTYKLWARAQGRFGNYKSLKWSVILSVLTPFLWMLGSQSGSWLIYLAFVLVGLTGNGGIAGGGYYMNCIAIIFEYSEDEHKPIYTSLYFFATGLASAIAPTLGGYLLQHFNNRPFRLPLLDAAVDGYKVIFAVSGLILIGTTFFLPLIRKNTSEGIAARNEGKSGAGI